MHWNLNKLSPQCRNVIWQDELYQLVSSGHVWPARILAEIIGMTNSGIMYRLDISTFYFYEPLLVQIFLPGKFIKTSAFPCLLSLLQSTATQITVSINKFVSNIHYEISFVIKKQGFLPLLFFLIKTTVYRKKTHYRKK